MLWFWLIACNSSVSTETAVDSGQPLIDSGLQDTAAEDSGVEPPANVDCTVTEDRALCAHQTVSFAIQGEDRRVLFATPSGPPPAEGWPVVIGFQGSFTPPEYSWDAASSDLFGAYHQVRLTQALLEAGYAVLTPAARFSGTTAWETNLYPTSVYWEGSADDALMGAIFAAIDAGEFGDLDGSTKFATGISSGGYMTSRMALSYPGEFQALAVMAGSWATCLGPACDVPNPLPSDHAPTLLVHGTLDAVVPMWTAERYHDALLRDGHTTDFVRVTGAGHEWVPEAVDTIPAWFDRHR